MIDDFWGKAQPDSGTSTHPLPAHSLDVAAVAILLSGRRHLDMDPRMLGFLVSLHDIGKYSRPFQAKARECWPTKALGPYPTTNPPPGPAHDVVGLHFLSDVPSANGRGTTARLEGIRPHALMAGTDRTSWPASFGDQSHFLGCCLQSVPRRG